MSESGHPSATFFVKKSSDKSTLCCMSKRKSGCRDYANPVETNPNHLRNVTRIGRKLALALGIIFILFVSMQTVAAVDFPLKPSLTTSVHGYGHLVTRAGEAAAIESTCSCKTGEQHDTIFKVKAALIPILVLLSGLFAGLTLGYMSLDPTQLQVLSMSGTPLQQKRANAILPVRKDGHQLLITLLLANMVVNETLPIIADDPLGGGFQAVVVSTVLIVIFAEIIPQSIFTRYGLAVGAVMAPFTRVMMFLLYPIAKPIAWFLHKTLGSHKGIMYRRAELKFLVNMHAQDGLKGGDLQEDTVAIVGGALDLQGKSVRDAMTPIEDIFMLSIESKLDYATLGDVVRSGHSRVPVYETVQVPDLFARQTKGGDPQAMRDVRNILGVLLVKQCVLLDPEDAVPLKDIPLNAVPRVPSNRPLLEVLNTFQEGRSHMAIVTYSRELPGQDSDNLSITALDMKDSRSMSAASLEKGEVWHTEAEKKRLAHGLMGTTLTGLPTDAKLSEQNVQQLYAGLEATPIGLITLEDILEELLGEEILDEYDGERNLASNYMPPEAAEAERKHRAQSFASLSRNGSSSAVLGSNTASNKPNNPSILKTLQDGILRSKVGFGHTARQRSGNQAKLTSDAETEVGQSSIDSLVEKGSNLTDEKNEAVGQVTEPTIAAPIPQVASTPVAISNLARATANVGVNTGPQLPSINVGRGSSPVMSAQAANLQAVADILRRRNMGAGLARSASATGTVAPGNANVAVGSTSSVPSTATNKQKVFKSQQLNAAPVPGLSGAKPRATSQSAAATEADTARAATTSSEDVLVLDLEVNSEDKTETK